MRFRALLLIPVLILFSVVAVAEDIDFRVVRAEVDFRQELQGWDGFGFNYVETAQTYDYEKDPQDYGGFSLLDDREKQKIIDLVFGDDGLKVGLLKMFLDPHHQHAADGPFDHKTSTANMRYFAREGSRKAAASGRALTIITTLYGPPAYVTRQRVLRGRDLDPEQKLNLARYMVDWVKYLREQETLPVRYVSLHNEGEDWMRWTTEGLTDNPGHDYNLFWPPEQVAEFLVLMKAQLRKAGLRDVGVTPGENTNWYRWGTWGYADVIAETPEALQSMDLITSHGFYSGTYGRWFGEHKSAGIDRLRALRPELHAWVTSTSWSAMDGRNIKEHHGNIYTAKVNGIIPWAGIQRPAKWVKGDPNPGSAFRVNEDGTWEARRGYYFYKQVSRAGQPGMAVARTFALDSEIALLGFAANGTDNPDAVVLVNLANKPRRVRLAVKGSAASVWRAFRTTEDEKDTYAAVGRFSPRNEAFTYEAPSGSVTTFFGEQ